MDPFPPLITALLARLKEGRFQIPEQMTHDEAEEFVLRSLDKCRFAPLSADPWVLIICEGGLVQEVHGVASDAYEIFDMDAREDSPEEFAKYFRDKSEPMKHFLLGSDWKHFLPRWLKHDTAHEVARWENEGGTAP